MWLLGHCPPKKSSGSLVPFAAFPSPVPWAAFHITYAVAVHSILSRWAGFYFSWMVLRSPIALWRVLGHSVSGGLSETPRTWRRKFSLQSGAAFLAFSLTEWAADVCVMLLRWLTSNLDLGLPALGGFLKTLVPFMFLDKGRRAYAFSLDHALAQATSSCAVD